ncbi:Multiple C2 and transmembrane domain-containing protein 2, partial [Temnothorax longispinosus]
MDTAPEIDFSSEPNIAGELNTAVPEIEVTSENAKVTSANDVASAEIAATSPSEKNFDDASKVDTASEIHVVSNTDVAFNKMDVVSTDISSDIADVASNKVNTVFTERLSDIAVPLRGLPRKPDRRERRHSIEVLDRSVSKHKFERNFAEAESDARVSNAAGVSASHGNFCGNIQREEENSRESSSVASEKSKIQQTFEIEELPKVKRIEELFVKTNSEITEEGSSAVDVEKSKLEKASAMIGVWKTRVPEGLSTESFSGIKKRKAKGSLGSCLKRKVDLIERILEDQVERIWDENVEKHTWLQ